MPPPPPLSLLTVRRAPGRKITRGVKKRVRERVMVGIGEQRRAHAGETKVKRRGICSPILDKSF